MRDCLRSHLFDPRMISYSNVMIHIQITQQQLWTLAKDGPDLRRKHLLELHKAAEDRGDSTQSSVILEILTREQEQKKWRRIDYSTHPQKGGAPIQIRVQSGQTTETYSTEQEVFDHTAEHLSKRFCLAYSAPCYKGQLFDNLGYMGDTECSQQILDGTYEYPPDTDIWTKKILQEAHHTFMQMSGIEISTLVTTEDFQNYWQVVDK